MESTDVSCSVTGQAAIQKIQQGSLDVLGNSGAQATTWGYILRDFRQQDLLSEIKIHLFGRRRIKNVTYGNFIAADVDIYVPTACAAVPVGRQSLEVGDRILSASEFLRVGFNMAGLSDVVCAEGFFNNVRNLSAADKGTDFSDVSSVASWSSCG